MSTDIQGPNEAAESAESEDTAAEAPVGERVAIAEDLDSAVERTAASPVRATRHRKQR